MALYVTDNPALGLALPLADRARPPACSTAGWSSACGLPPIIVTLATMSIWQGVALVVLPDPGRRGAVGLPGLS